MRDLRNSICTVVLIAILSAVAIPAFAGYAGVEGGPTPAEAQTSIVGGVIAHLKREDDEGEVRDLAERRPTLAEAQAARERREEAADEEAAAEPPPQLDEEEG
jgi:hypothetical protein